MSRLTLGMFYLYFPEDKTEYIPAVLSFSVFLIACLATFILVKKYSKKQEEKAKELEEQVKNILSSQQQKDSIS